MNGGRNYNGPKVARRNWIIREDTDYVYQDRKTLLSFTVA